MSHSRVWDEFVKIAIEKQLVKTAEKKDEAYNVKIPAASTGSESRVEDNGYDLIENRAHTGQTQVANSQLNDGIVENDVQRQRVMTDVALRNPRGVNAALIRTLVKAATILDAELNDECINMASEVDALIRKLSQAAPENIQNVGDGTEGGWYGTLGGAAGTAGAVGATGLLLTGPVTWPAALAAGVYMAIDRVQKTVGNVHEAIEKTGSFLNKLDFGYIGFRSSAQKLMEKKINRIGTTLQGFGAIPEKYGEENQAKQYLSATLDAIKYINSVHSYVVSALTQTSDLGADTSNAKNMWDKMASMVNEWLASMNNELIKYGLVADPNAKPVSPPSPVAQNTKPTVAPPASEEAPTTRPVAKQPLMSAVRHVKSPFSASGPEVTKLQKMLGDVDVDGKFGNQTFQALKQKAAPDSLLSILFTGKPELASGFKSWTSTDVADAIQRLNTPNIPTV